MPNTTTTMLSNLDLRLNRAVRRLKDRRTKGRIVPAWGSTIVEEFIFPSVAILNKMDLTVHMWARANHPDVKAETLSEECKLTVRLSLHAKRNIASTR